MPRSDHSRTHPPCRIHEVAALSQQPLETLLQLGIPAAAPDQLARGIASWRELRAESSSRLAGQSIAGDLAAWLAEREDAAFWEGVGPGAEPLRAWLARAVPLEPGVPLAWTVTLRTGAGLGRSKAPRVALPEPLVMALPLVADLVDPARTRQFLQGLLPEGCDEALEDLLHEAVSCVRGADAVDRIREQVGEGEWGEVLRWAQAQAEALGVPSDITARMPTWPDSGGSTGHQGRPGPQGAPGLAGARATVEER